MNALVRPITLAVFFVLGIAAVSAQEKVTIPKSRLEELERKEAELEKLKNAGTASSPAGSAVQAATAQTGSNQGTTVPVRQTAPVYQAPPIASLPPLKPGEVVKAVDVASHYASAPTAAKARYGKQPFVVTGEVVSIEKHLLRRTFAVTLKTAESLPRVICEITAPEEFNAIYTKDAGSELVGSTGHGEEQLAKIGKMMQVQVRSKGLKGSAVVLSGKLR